MVRTVGEILEWKGHRLSMPLESSAEENIWTYNTILVGLVEKT
jgi:hypothetical protein